MVEVAAGSKVARESRVAEEEAMGTQGNKAGAGMEAIKLEEVWRAEQATRAEEAVSNLQTLRRLAADSVREEVAALEPLARPPRPRILSRPRLARMSSSRRA